MPGPLNGVKVLDFSAIIAGPFAGMQLADPRAEVIKVEPVRGEPGRLVQEFIPGESRFYMSINPGKHSLPLDQSRPEAREIVYKLVTDMDAVIVNYRPDVTKKLGIDYETLSGINRRLIYCEATAFGKEGRDSYRPATTSWPRR